MAQSEIDDAFAVLDSEAIGKERNGLWPICSHLGEGRREFAGRARRIIVNVHAEPAAGRFGIVALQVFTGMLGISDDRNAAQIGNEVAQQL